MHVFNWFPFPNDVSDYRVSLRHQKNHRDIEYEIYRQLCRENKYSSPVQPRHYSLVSLSVIRVGGGSNSRHLSPACVCGVRCGVRQMAAQSPPVPRPGHTSCGTVSPGDQRCPGHSYSPTAATDRSLAELSAVDSGQCWQHGGPGPQPGAPPAQAHVLSS